MNPVDSNPASNINKTPPLAPKDIAPKAPSAISKQAPTAISKHEGVVASVSPAINSPEQADAELLRIKALLSPSGARALEAFNPTDVAKINRLLSDD